MSKSTQTSDSGGQSNSGYSREQPHPDDPKPHGPGEGSPHDHQNDPKHKPSTDPHKSDDAS